MIQTASPSAPIDVAGMTIQFLLEPDQTAGAVSVFRCDLPVGARNAAPHSHDAFDETVYGLSGTTTWTVDGTPHDVGPGEVLFIPRGAVHGFSVSEDDASILCVATPGLFRRSYFTELADVLEAAGDGPPDHAAIVAVMQRHGLTPARL